MKRIVKPSLALAGIMALVLAGCAAEAGSGGTGTTTTTETEAAETAEVESSETYTMFEYFDEFPEAQANLDVLRALAAADAVPISVEHDKVKIALVFPSFNLSEGWARGAVAFERRLIDLGINFQLDEYGSTDQDHQRQSSHVDAILAAGDYDFVLFGPTELFIQKANIERMVASGLPVMVWNYNTPFKEVSGDQPLSYIGFDHAEGAALLCEWTLERTGGVGEFADMRFMPGFIDDQRNKKFSECVEKGGMTKVYDHFSEGDAEKAYEGTQATLTAYPDVVMIHAGNTASALGTVRAATERGVEGDIIINGWGGGRSELDSILEGGLNVTPLRLQDDFGVFPAEMIKMYLEGNAAQIPVVGAGEYTLVDDTFSAQDMLDATEYAYRYSKTLER